MADCLRCKIETIEDTEILCDGCKQIMEDEYKDALKSVEVGYIQKEWGGKKLPKSTWNCCGKKELRLDQKCPICGDRYDEY
jgi:hypothetical protein